MCNIEKRLVEINNYWLEKFDWLEKDYPTCFICGDDSHLQQCHLIPKAKDGTIDCDNIVLLCKRCHSKAPNTTIKDIMLNWIYKEANGYDKTLHTKHTVLNKQIQYILKINLRLVQNVKITNFNDVIIDFIDYKFKNDVIYVASFYNANEVTNIEYLKYLSEYDNLIEDFLIWYLENSN